MITANEFDLVFDCQQVFKQGLKFFQHQQHIQ